MQIICFHFKQQKISSLIIVPYACTGFEASLRYSLTKICFKLFWQSLLLQTRFSLVSTPMPAIISSTVILLHLKRWVFWTPFSRWFLLLKSDWNCLLSVAKNFGSVYFPSNVHTQELLLTQTQSFCDFSYAISSVYPLCINRVIGGTYMISLSWRFP